jgi:hypothetical protein
MDKTALVDVRATATQTNRSLKDGQNAPNTQLRSIALFYAECCLAA